MKKIYAVALFAAFNVQAYAQPTITGAQINPVIGEQLIVSQGNYLSPGASGSNQTWDFSGITSAGNATINITASDPTHPNTNLVYDYGSGTKLFYNMDANEQNIYYQESSGVVFTFSNPQTFLEFPLNSSTNISDAFAATFTNGVSFSRQGNSTITYDGYGTTITPTGTYTDCIKIKLVQPYTDTYSGGTITYYVESYYWFKAGIHFPVMAMISFDVNGTLTEYSNYYVGSTLGLEENSIVEASIYPNPVNDKFTINIPNNSEQTTIEILNLEGKTICSSLNQFNNGSCKIDVSNLASGIYIIQARMQDGTIARNKFQKH